jgi:hypothetical protein
MQRAKREKEMIETVGSKHYLGYHRFASDGETWGSFEVFQTEEGFYWWPCFPGCLPDGEPVGPFASAKAAYEDACEDEERNKE